LLYSSSIIIVLLSNVSKMTLLFTYVMGVFFFVYKFNLSYYLTLSYSISILLYIFIKDNIIVSFSKYCFGSKEYIEKLNEDNKRMNIEISNKIIKMEKVLTLVTSKIKDKPRIKKNDKELFLEEIEVFDELMKKFASNIKDNYDGRKYYGKLEKEIYKYGIDLLYFDTKENVFKDKIIVMNIRCEKEEINKIIIPLINRMMKKRFEISKINNNEVFGFYELELKQSKNIKFNFGISQRAKDEKICGDSYLIYENEEKYIFAISDGMGVGIEAKNKSKKALDLLKQFMDIGFEEKQALKSINYILRKEESKESYTTLDLFIYDKVKDEFYFSKNGASNSYLINKMGAKVIEGNDLPIGIIDKVEFKESKRN